jgi:glycosyltransferase involved in cell wall biosynthesis
MRNAALVHYTSDQERIEAEALQVTAAVAIIPNALPDFSNRVAAGEFRARYPELQNRRIVLFLSRLDPIKGLDLLLPAFAKLRRQVPNVSLVVAGTGETEFVNGLKAKAESLGIAADVLWPGFLEGIEKQSALTDADLFVLPSYSENFGIAALEAMAAGLPVIVSDHVAIHREISQARAGMTVACDVNQITDALARLLSDSTLRRSMAEDGRCLVRQKYSSDAVARMLIGVYDQVAATRDAAGRSGLPTIEYPIHTN